VAFELVHGGVEDVRGRTFGHLTFTLTGDPAAVADAVAHVATLVEVTAPGQAPDEDPDHGPDRGSDNGTEAA
jgi:hypothetical protein